MKGWTALTVCLLTAGGAGAGITTGSFTDPHALPADLVGLGVTLDVGGWSHDGTNYHEWWLTGGEFLENPDGPDQGLGGAFLEGAVLGDGFMTNGYLRMGTARYIQDKGGFWVYDSVGEIGESLYLGFRTSEYLADENRFAYRYGFIQAVKQDELSYAYVGWAYQTDADTAIVTFNLVPTPSATAMLGLGGLAAARRRR